MSSGLDRAEREHPRRVAARRTRRRRPAAGQPRGLRGHPAAADRDDTTRLANVVVRGVSEQRLAGPQQRADRGGHASASGQDRGLRRQASWSGGFPTPAIGADDAVRRPRLGRRVPFHRRRVGVRVGDLGRERAVHAGVPRRGLPVGHLPAGRSRRRSTRPSARSRPTSGSRWTSHRESDVLRAAVASCSATILRILAIVITEHHGGRARSSARSTRCTPRWRRGRPEIAVLLTLGFQPRSVLASFLVESALIAAIGGVHRAACSRCR